MHRRRLLTTAGFAALPLFTAGRLFAAPAGGARFLLIFLRGAYDAANLLVPVSSDFYYASRPTIAVARPNPADANAASPINGDWGLHPALKDSLLPLYAKGEIAFVPFAGADDLSRSHFETQDTIELGQGERRTGAYGSGFMSRLAQNLAGVRPIAFTDQLPLTFRGGAPTANMSVNVSGKPGIDDRQARLIQDMYAGQALAGAVKEGFEVRDEVYRSLSGEMAAANRGAASPKGFELSARRIARLMKTDFNLGFVDVGGWDTHVNQGGGTGYLAGRLGELGRGLSAYAQELGPDEWRKSVVVVVSEFGRTFRENGAKGTDHGHGSVYWILGGGIRGGRVLGRQVSVAEATLNQNRDYPVLNEYRSLLGGVFKETLGLSDGDVARVFPGVSSMRLDLV
jgi:uncharacterized protein (DUF1501 family)